MPDPVYVDSVSQFEDIMAAPAADSMSQADSLEASTVTKLAVSLSDANEAYVDSLGATKVNLPVYGDSVTDKLVGILNPALSDANEAYADTVEWGVAGILKVQLSDANAAYSDSAAYIYGWALNFSDSSAFLADLDLGLFTDEDVTNDEDLNNWSDIISAPIDISVAFSEDFTTDWTDDVATGGESTTQLEAAPDADDFNAWDDSVDYRYYLSIYLPDANEPYSDTIGTFANFYATITETAGFFSDSVRAPEGIATSISADDFNQWSDSLGFTKEVLGTLTASFTDTRPSIQDDKTVIRGYEVSLSDTLDLWADSVLYILTFGLKDDLNNWSDTVSYFRDIPGFLPISFSDSMLAWSDTLDGRFAYLVRPTDSMDFQDSVRRYEGAAAPGAAHGHHIIIGKHKHGDQGPSIGSL